jgi:hypothetical protein
MVQNRSHRSRATFATRNQLRSRIRTGAALLAASATLSTPATGASTDAGRHALGPEHTPPRASLALRRCTCMRPWRLFRKRRCRARPYLTHGKVRNGGMQLATRFSEVSFSTRTHVLPPPFRPWRKGGPKTFFRKPPRHCAALVRMVSGGAGTLNPSRIGARAAVEAVSVVHDVHYVA